MDQLLFMALNGAKGIMQAQAVNANNLANASTDGFRAEMANTANVTDASGATSLTSYSSIDFSPGAIRHTGRDLDVAINNEGWLAVKSADGSEAYTRRGDLHIDAQGQVTTGNGLPVMGNAGPIALPPYSTLEIGADGTISIRPQGSDATVLAAVDRLKLVAPPREQLVRGEDGLMRLDAGGGTAPASAEVSITSGALEGSNVNAVESMVKMIELARSFEAQIKLMQSAEENGAALTEIMKIS